MKKSMWILGSLCIVMTAAAVFIRQTEDREGPEIFFDGEEPVYRQGMDTEELLKGARAEDEQDGDVSSSLRIEAVYRIGDGKQAIAVYAAKDSQNHVTKKKRVLSCGMEEIQTDLQNDTVPTEGALEVTEEDAAKEQTEGLDNIDLQRPKLYLSVYEVMLQKGEPFESLLYVDRIEDDSDREEELWTNIQVIGTVDCGTVGTYTVEYLVTDSDGNRSETAVLTVHVAETA